MVEMPLKALLSFVVLISMILSATITSLLLPNDEVDGYEKAVCASSFSSPMEIFNIFGERFMDVDIFKGVNYFYAYTDRYSTSGSTYVKRSVDGVTWPGGTGTTVFSGLDRQQGGFCVYNVSGTDHIIASVMGYVEKSTDNGTSFISLASLGEGASFVYNSVATNASMDPSRSYDNDIYIVANRAIDGIYLKRSVNDGSSWTTYTVTSSVAAFPALVRNDSKLYCFYSLCTDIPIYTAYAEVYVVNSTDWGKTWGSPTKIFTASEGFATVGHAQYLDEERCLVTITDRSSNPSNSRGVYGYFWYGTNTFQEVGFETGPSYNNKDGHSYAGIAFYDAQEINYTSIWSYCYPDPSTYIVSTHYSHTTKLLKDPIITTENPDTEIGMTDWYTFNASATIPDNGSSIWSLDTNASWLSIEWCNETNCLIRGIPSSPGLYGVWLNITDADSNDSLYWNITVNKYTLHAPIWINGNAGFLGSNASTGITWGSGTAEDPFVIQGWEIFANDAADAILISNTTYHFIIANCSCYNTAFNSSFDGIRLINVENGIVKDNICLLNGAGIHTENCRSVIIKNNAITLNGDGIDITESDRLDVADNLILLNVDYGLFINNSCNITAKNNNMSFDSIVIEGDTFSEWDTHTITSDNRVNGNPVRFFKDGSELDLDGIVAGQIIVVNYSSVSISNIEVHLGDGGIDMGYVTNINVSCNNLSNNQYGIYLWSCQNATVAENNVSFNPLVGIQFDNCTDATAVRNVVISCEYGIFFNSSTDVSAFENLISDCYYSGIEADFCSNANCTDNVLISNLISIFYFECNNSTAMFNNISSGSYGVVIFYCENSSAVSNTICMSTLEGVSVDNSNYCSILNNDISSNQAGILLWESENSTIQCNSLSTNLFGIYTESSIACTVFGNNFLGNTYQSYMDADSQVEWDAGYPSGGNYWEGESTSDVFHGQNQNIFGSDGICDFSLSDVNWDSTVVDNYPLTTPSSLSDAPPTAGFEVFSFTEDSVTTVYFDATACSDPDNSAFRLLIRWDWNGDGSWDTPWSSTMNMTRQYSSDLTCAVRMQLMDPYGLTDETEVFFSVGAPPMTNVTLLGGIGIGGWYTSILNVSLTSFDASSGVNWIKYRLNGGEWSVYTGPIALNESGNYSIEYYSVDNMGNAEILKNLTVKIDNIAPVSSASKSNMTVILSSIDQTSGVNCTMYRINGGTWRIYNGSFNVTGSGNNTVEYYSTDNAGNAEEIKTISVDNEEDGGTGGGGLDPLALIMILLIICILIGIAIPKIFGMRRKAKEADARAAIKDIGTPMAQLVDDVKQEPPKKKE